MSFRNYYQLCDITKSCHIFKAVYWTPDMIFKFQKICIILFYQVFQKQIQKKNDFYFIFSMKKNRKKKSKTFSYKNGFKKVLPIKRHPRIISCYQGSLLNAWHDFRISQNRQFIVSAGFTKTNSKEYTDFYCIFSVQKNLKKKICQIFQKYESQKLLPFKRNPKILSCY